MFYFLREDFDGLNTEIEKVADKIKEIGKDMGQSCREGAETFHDNFAFEDGERQQYMWSTRLRQLIGIRNQARVVEPRKGDKVSLGLLVTLKDTATCKVRTMRIGSYMVFAKREGEEIISYNAPLARMLIGAEIGDVREAIIGGKKRSFHILNIE